MQGLKYDFDSQAFKDDLKRYLNAYAYKKTRGEYEASLKKFKSVIDQYYAHYSPRYKNMYTSIGELSWASQYSRSYSLRYKIIEKTWGYIPNRSIEATISIDPADENIDPHASWSHYTKNGDKWVRVPYIEPEFVYEAFLSGYHGAKWVTNKYGLPVMSPSPSTILNKYIKDKKYESEDINSDATDYAEKQYYDTLYFV